ncbi:uncharacterized protein BDW43DRAFT_322211 [Aspergillus alliaceus]|uniref:uncharacterized protein n=1 Tax=Petromyces alliaceus TaxID=209559 RepID=UPI0012A77165|nr:uncharacterized protein BDW43DRAFT_322211 [Aspergillus alliaceus]KAB8229428.1 hypothetical protein BDW43DRAFT_322211 [Aspergillus alliaceus]
MTSLEPDTLVTPENYIRAIISLSRRHSSTSSFPGRNYVDIAEWLLQDRRLLKSRKLEEDSTLFASMSEQPHDLVVVYDCGEKKWDVQHYHQEQHEAFFAAVSVPSESLGQVVFIRGFLSPSWVSVLGSKYNVDPEFFRRHMDFLSTNNERHFFSLPSLANSSNDIFRLSVSTLVHRDNFGRQNVQSQSSELPSELGKYKMHQLGSKNVCCGVSLVREYTTVCASFSVIEQWISVYIAKTSSNWAVIVWMDHGRPLEQSPPWPWTSHIDAKAIPLPVLQHHPKMAFRTTTNRLNADANATSEFQQSTALLPLQYDSLIALVDLARRAPQDPLAICIPLFAHAAFSEVQFLNLMESRIRIQIDLIVAEHPADALETLQYFTNILNRHAQQLKDSARVLCKLVERTRQGLNGAKVESMTTKVALHSGHSMRFPLETERARNFSSPKSDGTFTPGGIIEDYDQLFVRCIDLSRMCTQGINLAMNKATIEESRRAIEQSQRVKRLTLLATLFIPLSFSSSLLGMNIDLLEQNAVKFWWFFVLCVPITLVASIIYFWDFHFLRRCWARFWKRCRCSRLHMKAERHEKDPDHIV